MALSQILLEDGDVLLLEDGDAFLLENSSPVVTVDPTTTGILRACLEHLDTFIYQPQPEVLWPGLQSEPPEEGMWLQPGYFPNEPKDMAWDNDSCIETRGFLQILVYFRVRPDVGQLEPSTLADAVIAHFPKGLTLGPVRVRKRPYQSPKIDEADRSFIPVTVPYLGLT